MHTALWTEWNRSPQQIVGNRIKRKTIEIPKVSDMDVNGRKLWDQPFKLLEIFKTDLDLIRSLCCTTFLIIAPPSVVENFSRYEAKTKIIMISKVMIQIAHTQNQRKNFLKEALNEFYNKMGYIWLKTQHFFIFLIIFLQKMENRSYRW